MKWPVAVALAGAALSLATASGAMAAKPSSAARQAARGLAFAQAHCSGCHGVTLGAVSPNPESPPFEAIANTPGLTRQTLGRFLRDSHNYPAAMDFKLDRARTADLAAYMLTLQRADFHPPI